MAGFPDDRNDVLYYDDADYRTASGKQIRFHGDILINGEIPVSSLDVTDQIDAEVPVIINTERPFSTEEEALLGADETTVMSPAKAAVRDEKYDVMRSGAIPDGTDRTLELKDAINIIKNTAKGAGFFRPGPYGFTDELLIDTNDVKLIGPENPTLKIDRNTACLVALSQFAAGKAAIRVQPATFGARLSGVEISGLFITGDPRYLDPGASDLKFLPYGIVLDLCHLTKIKDVIVDHSSTSGIATAANGGGSVTGPDQTFITNTRITTGGSFGLSVDHGHSFHFDKGLIEFCDVGVRVASVNSVFLSNLDIEWNTGVGARIYNSRNIVFDKVTWENNGRSYLDTNDEKVHLWVGTAAPSQVLTIGNFFHALNMRHIIRLDRGEYEDLGSFIFSNLEALSFVGGANSRVVYVTKDAGQAYVGGFGISYPTGFNSNVTLGRPEVGRIRTRRGQFTESYGTAVPTGGTYNVGDSICNTAVAAGGIPGWICTTAGTAGTLAVTGSITTGTKILTLSSSVNIGMGDYLTIAGVSGIKRVVSVSSGSTVTIHSDADATVSGAAVAYSAPTFKAMGVVAV